MNLVLDQVLRRLTTDPEFREHASSAPGPAAAEAGVTERDLAAAVSGDVVTLYQRGAHSLLIMAAAAAAGVDPMPPFRAARERELAATRPEPSASDLSASDPEAAGPG